MEKAGWKMKERRAEYKFNVPLLKTIFIDIVV